jgi:hypothetical protein
VFGQFSAGDSLRVARLQRRGISLDLHRDLTQPSSPLWEAWLAFLTQQAMGQPTYVLNDLQDGEGFLQVHFRAHQAAADVAFLAPSLEHSARAAGAWSSLLEGASIQAAGQGIQRVFANLPESSAEVEVFCQAGFTPYAGEDIFRLDTAKAGEPQEGQATVRAQRPEDWPAVQKLCVAVTPQRVRQIEGGIAVAMGRARMGRRYVLPGQNGGDLAAALDIVRGIKGHWLRMVVHPDARQQAETLVRRGLDVLGDPTGKPVYCNVRQYESGVRAALTAAGFEPFATRTLMVKHTVAWSKAPLQELVPALQGGPEPVPPAYRINGEPEYQTPNGRLAAEREA